MKIQGQHSERITIVKNPCPHDVALIRPQRGLMKIVNHPRVILEEWPALARLAQKSLVTL